MTSMAWLYGSLRFRAFYNKLNGFGSSCFVGSPFRQVSLDFASCLETVSGAYTWSHNGATLLEKLEKTFRRKGREWMFSSVAVPAETSAGRFISRNNLIELERNGTGCENFVQRKRGFNTNSELIFLPTDALCEEKVSNPVIDVLDRIKEIGQSVPPARNSGKKRLPMTFGDSNTRGDVEVLTPKRPDVCHEYEESNTAHREPPCRTRAKDKLEEPPSEATYLRKRVGKIPGEIEGHTSILEKIRSLGALCAVSQKDQASSLDSQSLVHASQLGSKEESPAQESLQSQCDNGGIEQTESRQSANAQPSQHKLYVKFLHPEATNDELQQAFEDCGEVVSAQAVKPQSQYTRFTHGFVEFKTAKGLRRALKKDVEIRGIKVEPSPSIGSSDLDTAFSALHKLEPKNSPSSLSASILSTLKSSNSGKTKEKDSFDISKVISLIKSTSAKKQGDLDKIVDAQVFLSESHNACVVGIQDFPPDLDLHQVQQALSVFGEVAHSYMKRGISGGSYACIGFKSEEAKENALAHHWIYVNGRQLRISRIDPPKTPIIRISNVHKDTAKSEILSLCMPYGQVVKIEPRIEGVVDVYFSTGELNNVNTILDRLNEIVLSHKRWTAKPAPIFEHTFVYDDRFVCLQKDKLFKHIQKLLQQISMHLEDLNRLDRFDNPVKS